MKFPITLKYNGGSYDATPEQITAIMAGGEHFKTKQRMPWGTVSKVEGMAITVEWKEEGLGLTSIVSATFHGRRSLSKPRESGYQMEGQVSLNGKRYRAFTSDAMLHGPGGPRDLHKLAVLHVCTK